ncbi:MAG: hypothetical protein ACXAEU_12640 [Candidatus Hodarchaeales archaeon]
MEERHVPQTVLPTGDIHPCPKMDRAFCPYSSNFTLREDTNDSN